MRKSVLVAILSAILAAVVAVGAMFLYFDFNKKKTNIKFSCSIDYLQSEYTVGDEIIYRFVVYSDIELKTLKYKLANGAEQTVDNVKFGQTKELSEVKGEVGKYFADTKVQIIQTTELPDGYYTLVFFGYDQDNTRYEITSEPYSFKLVAASAG